MGGWNGAVHRGSSMNLAGLIEVINSSFLFLPVRRSLCALFVEAMCLRLSTNCKFFAGMEQDKLYYHEIRYDMLGEIVPNIFSQMGYSRAEKIIKEY